jgi:hypothetical protein
MFVCVKLFTLFITNFLIDFLLNHIYDDQYCNTKECLNLCQALGQF